MFNIGDSRTSANFWDVPVLYGESGSLPQDDIERKDGEPRGKNSLDARPEDDPRLPKPHYLRDEVQKRSLGHLTTSRNSLPILHARGSFYEVGFKIGRTFSRLIQNYIDAHQGMQTSLALYETQKGKHAFDSCYDAVSRNYPQYIRELRGLAAGSDIPFYKLFLLHMEDIIVDAQQTGCEQSMSQTGSTTVIVTDNETQFLGQVVDHSSIGLGNAFLVHATIDECCPEQEFTALSIGGMLPGHTMGYNCHGLVFAIDPIPVEKCNINGIPRSILSRALLAADTYQKVEKILNCTGLSIGNGMAVNASILLPSTVHREFRCYEVAPKFGQKLVKSAIARCIVQPPKYKLYYHTNKFQQLDKIREKMHTIYANWVLSKMGVLMNVDEKIACSNLPAVLGDSSVNSLELSNIFTSVESRGMISLAVGIFDFTKEQWSLYLDNPAETDPILTIPLGVKE